MTLTAFRVQYPEFVSAPDAYVNAFLAAAALQLGRDYWGAYYDQGHGLLTAHLMATAPNGQMARLESDKATSTYWARFEKMREEVAFADRSF